MRGSRAGDATAGAAAMCRIVLDDVTHGNRGEDLIQPDILGIHLLLGMLGDAESLSGGERLHRLAHALIGRRAVLIGPTLL